MGERFKVIIADDNEAIRDYMENILKEIEYVELIGKAKDGQEELELIKELNPDIVLTDNDMPNLKGIEVIEKIKEEMEDNAPMFYMLTGLIDQEMMTKLFELKVDGYFRKPFEKEELIREFERILAEDNPPIIDNNIKQINETKKENLFKRILNKLR